MTTPPSTRVDPPFGVGERDTLLAFLDYHRATLAWKCEGLSTEQLATRACPPSALSLLGLVRHLADVERRWIDRALGRQRPDLYETADDPDADFHGAAPDPAVVRQAFDDWQRAAAETRQVLGDADLDATFVHPKADEPISLRWLMVHLIEEYARHNGHADLLREALDGATGE